MSDGWLPALAANLAFVGLAYASRAVEWTGALAGGVLGLVIYLATGPAGYAVFAGFVVLGSGFTRLGYRVKQRRGAAQSRGGQRTWRNAVANCGVGAVAGLVALRWPEHAAAAKVALCGSFVAALADTTESELGTVVASQAYLPPRFRAVPAGTEGAMSLAGTLLGLLVAVAMACGAAAAGLVGWPAALAVAVGGWLATILESFVGAGRELNNEALNLLCTGVGALLAVGLTACRG